MFLVALALGWWRDHAEQQADLDRANVMIAALREVAEPPEESLVIAEPPRVAVESAKQFIDQHFHDDLKSGEHRTHFWQAVQTIKKSLVRLDTIEPLLALVSSPSAEVRDRVVISLGEFDVGSEAVIAALSKSLRDSEPNVRRHAADAIGELGPKAADAIPLLAEALLNDKSAAMQTSVAKAMWKVSHDARAIGIVNALLIDDDRNARVLALETLAVIGPAAGEKTVQQASVMLADEDSTVQELAVLAIPKIMDAVPARDALLHVFPRLHGNARRLAAASLQQLDQQLARDSR
jgi:HEAT repeat protein